MSVPSQPYYFVQWPNGGVTNATSYASARVLAGFVPGSKVVFSHSEKR